MKATRLAVLVAATMATLCGPALGAQPADGKLLFVSNRGGNAQIFLLGADGSGERALTSTPEENSEPAWSPDGKRVAFTSYRDGNADIYVMDADGSQQRRLTDAAQADNAPAWTPDGRIVFRSMRDRWANFYVVNADGSNLQQLTSTPLDKGAPFVSPDGKWIAFVAHGEKGSSDICVLPTAGGELKNLTAAISGNQKTFPAWSPDGKQLAYVEAKSGAINVRAVDPVSGNVVKITDNLFVNSAPIWSPDGKRIAFVSSREGSRMEQARGDIYVMNADGSAAVNLTHHPAEDNYPAWSADGLTVYFVSLRDGNAQLYAVPAAGAAEARRLTHNKGYDLMIRTQALLAH